MVLWEQMSTERKYDQVDKMSVASELPTKAKDETSTPLPLQNFNLVNSRLRPLLQSNKFELKGITKLQPNTLKTTRND